eukprot:gene12280-biopygen8586
MASNPEVGAYTAITELFEDLGYYQADYSKAEKMVGVPGWPGVSTKKCVIDGCRSSRRCSARTSPRRAAPRAT